MCDLDRESLGDRERTAARREDVGFIYQFHHLLPEFTAAENIVLPQLANGIARRAAEEHAASLLGPILEVKRRDDQPLYRKALDSAKAYGRKLIGPRETGLKVGTGVAVFLLLFFAFVDGDFRVTADARLEGTIQRVLAAPMAGYISQASVRAGDQVTEGQVMATLGSVVKSISRGRCM